MTLGIWTPQHASIFRDALRARLDIRKYAFADLVCFVCLGKYDGDE